MEDGVRPMIDNRLDHLPLRISQALDSEMVPCDSFYLFAIALGLLRTIVRAICNREVSFSLRTTSGRVEDTATSLAVTTHRSFSEGKVFVKEVSGELAPAGLRKTSQILDVCWRRLETIMRGDTYLRRIDSFRRPTDISHC
jgi:hypothetical protein